jgi:hypothetical protein
VLVAAIIACEIGFWALLGAGLAVRIIRGPRGPGAALLLGVPAVGIALLGLTVVDLHRGADPAPAHSFAALYVGFTIGFGPGILRWADARAAQRLATATAPQLPPPSGSEARMHQEWRAFASAVIGAAISAAVLLGLVALSQADGRWALLRPLPGVGVALAIWLIGWPAAETFRVYSRHNDPGAQSGPG